MADRPDVQAGLELRSVIAAPVTSGDGAVLGVIEAVNREDGDVFDAKQIPLLAEIAEVAGLAIANARNVEAERRASDLGALLETAQELSAHLDPQKVTFTLVHKAATVLQYRTASVGLFRGSRFDLAAVSGQTVVDESLPEMRALRDLLEWAAGLDHGLYVVQEEDGTIDTDRPETREKFRAYFEVSGTRSFVSVPLADDEGRLGVFALEAAEPYVYSERDIEAASLLGVQATVAIRNATLYRQIPMMHVMRPLAEHRDRLIRLPWARRAAGIGAVVLAAAVLAIPVPLRIGGDARVLPVRKLPSTAEVEGRLIRVLVREGDRVEAGQVLAEMDDADYRGGLGDARARYETVLREQRLRRSEGDTGAAAVEAARLEGLRAEVALWEDRIAKTAIRAATGGLVATPRVDERVGERLARGDVFCEVVDPASQAVELSVYEQDAGIVRAGMPVKIKLNAYPTRSLRGEVERIGVAAAPAESGPAVLLRVRLAAGAPALVTGMTGRAKVSTGLVPLGRVVFRRPARWIWSWLWGWLP
jgi:GAF domain-containing protein